MKDTFKNVLSFEFWQKFGKALMANLNRPSMLALLKKRLPTIWKLKKDMLFLD